MIFSKYLSAYSLVYKRTFDDCVKFKWLFVFCGICELTGFVPDFLFGYFVFGSKIFHLLIFDKESVAEAIKNAPVAQAMIGTFRSVLFIILVKIITDLLQGILRSISDSVLFRSFYLVPKKERSWKAWIIQSVRKSFGKIFLLRILEFLIMGMVAIFVVLLLRNKDFQDIFSPLWVRRLLTGLIFAISFPVIAWLGMSKVNIIRGEGVGEACSKGWEKLRAGNWYFLKAYLLIAVSLGIIWFAVENFYSLFQIDSKESLWFYWVFYPASWIGSVLIGFFYVALYCRISKEKIPSFAKK